MIKIHVFINEQHKLTAEQDALLINFAEEKLAEVSIVKVPSTGWTLEEMINISEDPNYFGFKVFVSPIPVLIGKFVKQCYEYCGMTDVYVFHNDKRDKVEKDGKVFYTVAKDGWQLVNI